MTLASVARILPPVRFGWRRPAALFVLAAAVCPWVAAGAVALHLGDHHSRHRDPGHDAVALALHGHLHEAGTPEHEHALRLPIAAPLPAKASFAPLPAVLLRGAGEEACALPGLRAAARAAGHDPPRPRRSFAILRI